MTTSFPDISRWQGAIDWNQFRPVAVVIKAGGADGGLYEDIKFRTYSAAADAHGIPWMAYYFCDPGGDPGVQAAHFHSIAGAKARVADIESGGGNQRPFASVFCANLTAPILYSGLNHAQVDNLLGIADTWVAAYGTVEPTVAHIFWQHTSSARYPGIAGNVDESIFHGTLDDLRSLFAAAKPQPKEEEDMSYFMVPDSNPEGIIWICRDLSMGPKRRVFNPAEADAYKFTMTDKTTHTIPRFVFDAMPIETVAAIQPAVADVKATVVALPTVKGVQGDPGPPGPPPAPGTSFTAKIGG